jgi:hypothetical protein
MGILIRILAGLVFPAGWLVLLIATNFNPAAVGGGLLAALSVSGPSAGRATHRKGKVQ